MLEFLTHSPAPRFGIQLLSDNLARFFEQVAFSVMVRNGDGHLKNFAVLYRSPADCWVAPMFDVVTTAIYRYARYEGGPDLENRTLALKLFSGRHHTKAYPTTDELLRFGRTVCGVSKPAAVLGRIPEEMAQTLDECRGDNRIPGDLLAVMAETWRDGLAYAD